MSTNDAVEITRKVDLTQVLDYLGVDGQDQEDVGVYLKTQRRHLMQKLLNQNYVTLNEAYEFFEFRKSREGLTLGWGVDSVTRYDDLFIWSFCADNTVELTFHNLKDISDLYKKEEELA